MQWLGLLGMLPAALLLILSERDRSSMERDLRDAREARDRLADRVAEMERVEARERSAGGRLVKRFKAAEHRATSLLGEARAWRKRALALGWTKGGE